MDNSQPAGESVGATLRESVAHLSCVTDTPRLEAELLLARAMGLPRAALVAHPEWQPSPAVLKTYREWLERRAEHWPLPYLTGYVEFFGLEFFVSPDVLIPRPETELLVERALAHRPQVVLDVGTGSGCIGIALAHHLPGVRVYAADLSAAALRVAAANVRRHDLADRVRPIQADLLRPFRGPVDLILSNPPYVAHEEWDALPPSVRQYEPRLALAGGRDGLDVIRQLLAAAPRVLRPGGSLLMEIGSLQGATALALARSLSTVSCAVHPDLAGRDRLLEVRWDRADEGCAGQGGRSA